MAAIAETDRSFAGSLVSEQRDTFTVSSTELRRYDVKRGYGVWFSFVYHGDDADYPPDAIADVDTGIVAITPETCTFVGGVFCARVTPQFSVPVLNFRDPDEDEDDWQGICTDRWFPTEAEARTHQAETMRECAHRGLIDAVPAGL